MKANDIRCANDLSLFKSLKATKEVKKVNDMIAKHEAEGPSGTRRHLLSTSVRLSRRMAPDIHEMADDCIKLLGVKLPLELYVYSSPQFNAACFKPENDRLYVMFSSSLLEGFTSDELRFVMGHELGHHVYNHHDIPIGYLLKGPQRVDPKLALELFAWSRYAEISADRAGAHCAQNMDAVARALFKLSSGLTKNIVQFSLDDFVAQVDELEMTDSKPGHGASQADWFSTHPFSPLRVKALKEFEQSELYTHADGTVPKEDMEVAVQRLMSLMEPSYIEAKTDTAETMRRLLFAGLIAVADASHGISKKEIALFEDFFGKYSFKETLNIERLKATLTSRIEDVKGHASTTQAMQVLHDLCTMASVSGKVTAAERVVLESIGKGLGIAKEFITQSIDQAVELD